ncbi:MAG: ATPase P [Candidatus Latescibacterota bacterium]
MIEINIPGRGLLRLQYLVLDYNGTLACGGELLHGVMERLEQLAQKLNIYVLTADTFGTAGAKLENAPCELIVLPEGQQDVRKHQYVQKLGDEVTVCIGNGLNDRLMIGHAALGIAVVLEEGAAADTLRAADVVCTDITSALDLLLFPQRLIATLRT